jgi:pimeloyl-ACP methyl ester carboxylesterase
MVAGELGARGLPRYRSPERHGRGNIGSVARFTSFDDVELYYEEEGSGSPVVLLHGLSVDTEQNWRTPGIWAALVEAGHRVLGFDARGHGRSEKPHAPSAYGDDAMVKDVTAFFDQMGLDEVDLAGYSMGASTALQVAAREGRLRRLVLGGIGGDPARWGAADTGPAAMRKRWLAGIEADDPAAIDDPVARRSRRVFEARGNDLEAIAALLRSNRRHLSPDMASEAVAVPTLVVCGDRDFSPTELAAALPKGEALVIEGDHESAVRNPELAAAVVRFFAD